ncbi:hypothetical protein AB4Y30_13935 [Ornithinibacillus sp. 4-3]|uniref:Swt1-like HEPN domain-containing protein n=1 Tax=Ornithinibacillus sp. 4-3 TaxID=3231488 RepID=A0AB39HIM7_9BACI
MRIYETYRNSSNESTIIFKKESITGEELSVLKEDIKTVNKLTPVSERIKDLKKSYENFQNWESGKVNQFDDESIITDYIIKTVQFIEQWESFIKREYSAVQSKFIEKNRNLYEKSFEYRLIYNLRNMTSHTHHLPYTKVKKSIEEPPSIILEIDYLLKVHTGIQPSFKKELLSIDCKSLNLVEIINTSYPKLEEFHQSVSTLLIEEQNSFKLTSSTYRIIKFYNKYQEKNGVLGLTSDEIDIDKINKIGYRQTFKFTEIPYKLACFAALCSSMNFRLVGKVEKTIATKFPEEKDGIIYRGNKNVKYMEASWEKICEQVYKLTNNQNIYSCLYMIAGLSREDYKRKELEFIKKEDSFLSTHFNEKPLNSVSHESEVMIVYFHDEAVKDLELIYNGTVKNLRKDHFGNDWNGFGLGDSFQLNDQKVRVYSKTRSISEVKDRYFIGPSHLNPNKINYKKLDIKNIN